MEKQKTKEELLVEIVLLNEELKRKNELILLLQRQLYGRRSEKRLPKYEDAFPNLFSHLEGEDVLPEEQNIFTTVVEDIHKEATERRKKEKENKKAAPRSYKLPSDLRREDLILNPQTDDLSSLIKIGEDVTERLMHTPGEFWVQRIIRPIYKSKKESEDCSTKIHQHPQLHSILPGCIADGSLLSQIIVDKFQFALPEYRQSSRFKTFGIDISTSSINRWVHEVADKLYLLYELQVASVLKSKYIHIDETVQRVADVPNKTRKAYVWVVLDGMNEKGVFFYSDNGSRSEETVLKILKDFQGAIQCDGYNVYNIYENKKGVLLLGCLAHVRRKFENALKTTPIAQTALDYIRILYTLESNLKDKGADFETIRKERAEKAHPVLREFESWLINENNNHTPKSLMREAIRYAFLMLPRICRYSSNGRYNIDNNPVERIIRPITIGRKNYLFSKNNKGLVDNCIFYTFIETCKTLGIHPIDWFNWVFSKINVDMTESELLELLPVNYLKNNK